MLKHKFELTFCYIVKYFVSLNILKIDFHNFFMRRSIKKFLNNVLCKTRLPIQYIFSSRLLKNNVLPTLKATIKILNYNLLKLVF